MNDRLPSDIHVLSVLAVEDGFHARHSAVLRSYLYQISRRRSAFAKRYVWWVRPPLDRLRLDRAAAVFVGRHDFAAFCERPSEQPSTLVEVESVSIVESGGLILVRLVASHFLWKMVRRVVGALVRASTGEVEIDELTALLESRADRAAAGRPAEWTAPASGLFLERVLYPGDPPLGPVVAAAPVAPDDAGSPGRLPPERLPARRETAGRRGPRTRR